MSAARAPAVARVGGLGLAAATCALAACIIAEPPSELPALPEFRPTIVRDSVVPTANAIVGVFPEKFVVPVELVDPSVSFSWRAYVDYNPITGEGLSDFGTIAPGGSPARVRVLEVPLRPPLDLQRCHVIEFLVAQRFFGEGETAGVGAHTPRDPGGDSVTWYFSPGGDLRGCPVVDAGLPPPADASRDADGGGG